jgi:hypothetical protein
LFLVLLVENNGGISYRKAVAWVEGRIFMGSAEGIQASHARAIEEGDVGTPVQVTMPGGRHPQE